MQSALALETVIDQLPGARGVLADLADPALRPAAGTVEELLGAASDRADPAGQPEDARAARGATLLPDALLGRKAHEGGVQAGDDDRLRETLGQGLHPDAAAQGQDDICLLDLRRQRVDVLPLALALDRGVGNLLGAPVDAGRHAQAGGQDPGLLVAAGEADRDACPAADDQHLVGAGDQRLDLLKRFLLGNDHRILLKRRRRRQALEVWFLTVFRPSPQEGRGAMGWGRGRAPAR